MTEQVGVPQVPLGRHGLSVSQLGLGCMVLSDAYGTADPTESRATFELALERGITLLDTADKYAGGRNEELVGSYLGRRRDAVVIATKFGLVSSVGSRLLIDNSPDTIRRSCDDSLRRLGTDHIDLYYAHRLDPAFPVEETVGVMAELVDAGKVRYLGLSEVTAAELRAAAAAAPISAIQSEWSLFARDLEAEVLPTARELGIGIVPYAPLGRGFLAGAVRATAEHLEAADHRRTDPRFAPDALPANLELLGLLERMAAELNATTAQVALAWLRSQGSDVVAIPGMGTPEQLVDDVGSFAVHLDASHLELLDGAFAPGAVQGDRPNTRVRSATTAVGEAS